MTGHPAARRDTTGRIAETVYRLLLRAYPPAFREAYGREMAQLFRDQLRARSSNVAFWLRVLWDVTCSAPALRLDALRDRGRAATRAWRGEARAGARHFHREEGTMQAKRIVAIVAMVAGVFEIVNAATDVWAGGGGSRAGGWVLGIALAVLIGVLLLGAGVGLLRSRAGAVQTTRALALACLVLVVVLQLTYPFMSIFSRLLGVAVPIALLLVTRRRDPALPAVA